jgi:hypothetical protein
MRSDRKSLNICLGEKMFLANVGHVKHILRPELFFCKARGFRGLSRPCTFPNLCIQLSTIFFETYADITEASYC